MAFNHSRLFLNAFGEGFWPRYRGKRAGRLVKAREAIQRREILYLESNQVN